jgi:hypothetical protein
LLGVLLGPDRLLSIQDGNLAMEQFPDPAVLVNVLGSDRNIRGLLGLKLIDTKRCLVRSIAGILYGGSQLLPILFGGIPKPGLGELLLGLSKLLIGFI